MNRNEKRRRKYNLLIEAGFMPREATKYKDLGNWKVIKLIEAREKFNIKLDREQIEFDKEVKMILGGANNG